MPSAADTTVVAPSGIGSAPTAVISTPNAEHSATRRLASLAQRGEDAVDLGRRSSALSRLRRLPPASARYLANGGDSAPPADQTAAVTTPPATPPVDAVNASAPAPTPPPVPAEPTAVASPAPAAPAPGAPRTREARDAPAGGSHRRIRHARRERRDRQARAKDGATRSRPRARPRRLSKDTQAAQLLEVAKAKLANNLNEQALTDLRQIIIDFPGSRAAAEAAFMAGEIHEKTGRVDDAMAAYVEFESRFANDRRVADAKLRRSALLGRQRQPKSQALSLQLLNEVVRDYPGSAQSLAGAAKQIADRDRQQGPARDRSGDEAGRPGDHRDTAHAHRAVPGGTAIARGPQPPRADAVAIEPPQGSR